MKLLDTEFSINNLGEIIWQKNIIGKLEKEEI